ncbi:hypothetical protein KTR10_00435 [Candidatus Kaiserbacteria bacterium]|nr:hypothetical protein [Candidatus Kaiserbacteria bacterium]
MESMGIITSKNLAHQRDKGEDVRLSIHCNLSEDTAFSILSKKPTFIEGFAGLVDFRGIDSQFESTLLEDESLSDTFFVGCDWKMVGNYFNKAFKNYEQEKEEEQGTFSK